MRGDVWLVRFGAGEQGEPTKNRPGVMLNHGTGLGTARSDLCIMVPLSASMAVSMSRPLVAIGETGLKRESVAVPNAVRAVAVKRLLRRFGRLDDETMGRIGEALIALMDLPT